MSGLTVVTGATGNVGGSLVTALVAAGMPVRAVVRSEADAARFDSGAVQTAIGDLNEPASLAAALDGAQALFLLPGYADMPGVYAAAREAGVGHVVQLSGMSAASGDMSNAVTEYMVLSEQAAAESKLPHTVVRPSAFMTNALRWADQVRAGDTVTLPFPTVATACLHPADLGAVIAAVFADPDRYAGEVLLPTGPEALLPRDQVAIVAGVLDRPLTFVGLTDEQARESMAADGTPQRYIDAFLDFYAKGSLDESPVRSTVADVTGNAPRTFAAWAADNAEAFARS
ncbi:NmrA family protein [Catenulispora acidiphila DSM 44928]|uniref:NmrA family protein n=1 Tax=Catenulispora acidiphila (strain DSM 44928 / JCM 14897 / NBRC 102108 / NRRL B-24433 / ID139908) TaxID=479433 RepID=C7Q713_CATAD|nr:NmrA family NAD(P)-binding protein [Catenulispora acidiphila]ACU76026.1 NmrA family protein [Catenulispora acidiphila DSM 44928]